MTLTQMSLQGGAMIAAVMVLRALTLHRLPKGTFLALWAVAAARLLVPFSVPSPWSVYTLAGELAPAPEGGAVVTEAALPAVTALPGISGLPAVPAPTAAPVDAGGGVPLWTLVWLAGVLVCGLYFLLSYLRCLREFGTALPVDGAPLRERLAESGLRRPVALRQSDRIAAPLTYGVLRPVILLPKTTDWADRARLTWILEHELTHIRHLDALCKLVLTAAACVHWFNPLVWCMYLLANRDMELRCDEAVVRRLGVERRGDYARTLISMEARKSGLGPLASAFSKNAVEERIIAIMRLKKRSLAAVLTAAVLICAVSVAFATSAAERDEEDLRPYLTVLPGSDFTAEESRRLFDLWVDGYGDMTTAVFRERMRGARTDGDMELIERFSLSEATYQLSAGKEAEALAAFNNYFFNVYEPLTADQWRTRTVDGRAANGAEYVFSLTILDADALTVKEYDRARSGAEEAVQCAPDRAGAASALKTWSTDRLQFALERWAELPGDSDPDAAFHAEISRYASGTWDEVLSPYVPFGLTYRFDDPDNDGNGLTMWFEGQEVRGIWDGQENVWISEHTGDSSYSDGAVELQAVYTDGVLTGLRPATQEEQAAWDEVRSSNAGALLHMGTVDLEETREFPCATRADYDAMLSLKTADYAETTLEEFNRRLLDWANANEDAYDRINCDVIWNNYTADLTEEERAFVALTCRHSGTENGMMIRALHTGKAEQDPGFAASLPERTIERDGIVMAWCDLYYDVSYHISDKSAVTVGERDACVGGMLRAISTFWQDTDMEDLLTMTEEDVAARFNAWASECSTEGVTFLPITADNIQFESMDERSVYDELQRG